MKKFNYVMKLAIVIKETQCVLDTELVLLDEEEGNFYSHISLLDKVEQLRRGTVINKYEIKAIPVAFNSSDFICIDSTTKKGQWYMEHSKELEEGIFSLVKKIM